MQQHLSIEKYGIDLVYLELKKQQREATHALAILAIKIAVDTYDQGLLSASELLRDVAKIAMQAAPLQQGDTDLLTGETITGPEDTMANIHERFKANTILFADEKPTTPTVGEEGTSPKPVKPHLALVTEPKDVTTVIPSHVGFDSLVHGGRYQLRNHSAVQMHAVEGQSTFVSDQGVTYSPLGVAIDDDRLLDVTRPIKFEVNGINESDNYESAAQPPAQAPAPVQEKLADPVFAIEAGKKYRLRNGSIVRMRGAKAEGRFLSDFGYAYNQQGFYLMGDWDDPDSTRHDHQLNVVGEWKPTVKIKDGALYLLRNGERTIVRDVLTDPKMSAFHSQTASQPTLYASEGDAFSLTTGIPTPEFDAVEELAAPMQPEIEDDDPDGFK